MNQAQAENWDDRSFAVLRAANMARQIQQGRGLDELCHCRLAADFAAGSGRIPLAIMQMKTGYKNQTELQISLGLYLGSTVVIADLIAATFHLHLGHSIQQAFNTCSDSIGSNVKL